MNNPFSSAKGENLTSEARRHQSHPAATSASWRKELQLALVTVEIAANAHYSQSPLIEALWRGSRSLSAIQSNIPRKHWSLVWVWHLFLRFVQSPDCMKSKHQEKAKSLQNKSLLDSSYLETTPLHNCSNCSQNATRWWQRGLEQPLLPLWLQLLITQQLWNSCATNNKTWWVLPQGDCISRQGSRKHPCLLPKQFWHCHLFSLFLGMCLLHQSIHFGHTPQFLFFWHVLLSA